MKGPLKGNTAVIPSSEKVSTKRQRIAQLARAKPQGALSSLHHHIDGDWLLEAWRRTEETASAATRRSD